MITTFGTIMAEPLGEDFLSDVCSIVKILGHPARIQIIERLEAGEANVTELQEITGLSQPVTSQHLRLMRDKRILVPRRDGNTILYSIADPVTLNILYCLRKTRDQRV